MSRPFVFRGLRGASASQEFMGLFLARRKLRDLQFLFKGSRSIRSAASIGQKAVKMFLQAIRTQEPSVFQNQMQDEKDIVLKRRPTRRDPA